MAVKRNEKEPLTVRLQLPPGQLKQLENRPTAVRLSFEGEPDRIVYLIQRLLEKPPSDDIPF